MTLPAWLEEAFRLKGGWMSLHDWMQLCLYHPEHGYYTRHASIGRHGDFVTGPSLTPLFGATVGNWVVDVWKMLGKPEAMALVEFGAGEGDLLGGLLDDWEHTEDPHVRSCREAVRVGVVEVSATLRTRQEARLARHGVAWWDGLQDVPRNGPLVVLANEVLDAFAVRQVRLREDGAWEERGVDASLHEVWEPLPDTPRLPRGWEPEVGAVLEFSDAQQQWVKDMMAAIAPRSGAAWLCDYGYTTLPPHGGDSVQAVRAQLKVGVTHTPGETDITAHVDFGRINDWLGGHAEITDMGVWLMNHGLAGKALPFVGDEAVERAVERLVHPTRMGGLFKVLTRVWERG